MIATEGATKRSLQTVGVHFQQHQTGELLRNHLEANLLQEQSVPDGSYYTATRIAKVRGELQVEPELMYVFTCCSLYPDIRSTNGVDEEKSQYATFTHHNTQMLDFHARTLT